MPLCQGTKRDGTPCTISVIGTERYCWHHSPERAQERHLAAQRAGRARPSSELQGVKGQLQELVSQVRAGELDHKVAAVCGQLLNYLVRTVLAEVEVRESQEFEARLEEVEAAIEAQKSQRHSPGARRFPSQ